MKAYNEWNGSNEIHVEIVPQYWVSNADSLEIDGKLFLILLNNIGEIGNVYSRYHQSRYDGNTPTFTHNMQILLSQIGKRGVELFEPGIKCRRHCIVVHGNRSN
jgi:hypothetical protein